MAQRADGTLASRSERNSSGVSAPPLPAVLQAPTDGACESARYLELANDQIYTVTHGALGPRRGTVLLCGPFGVERERAYLTLVLWARLLATRGYEVLRFDYRGQGESTGSFEDMTLARWREDAEFCAKRLTSSAHGGALVVQGVRLGALTAAELFASGVGDGLLLWAPPASAEALLADALRHNLIEQRMADLHAPPRLREQLVAALEAGEPVNVDGYPWTRALWREARLHPLRLPALDDARPWRTLQAQSGAGSASETDSVAGAQIVDADTFWQSRTALLVPRSDGFFAASLRWLDECEPWNARTA